MNIPEFPMMAAELRKKCLDLNLFDHSNPVIFDTDTKNEIDDQFALVFALLSSKIKISAIYAVQYAHSWGPTSDVGLEWSYQEIMKILDLLKLPENPLVLRGNKYPLSLELSELERSDAVEDLIVRARGSKDFITVLSIGALTNVAAAILAAPDIASKILLLWLGGNEYSFSSFKEYNLLGDSDASKIVFLSGVAMIRFPAKNVTGKMLLDEKTARDSIRPLGDIGKFLFEIFDEYLKAKDVKQKEIWDLAVPAVLENPSWAEWKNKPMPLFDKSREWLWSERQGMQDPEHVEITNVENDAVFKSLIERMESQ